MLEGEPDPIEVRKLKDQLDASEWSHVFIRDTERKKLWLSRVFACIPWLISFLGMRYG
ncbi:MAG: hypothetical protein KAR25_08185 [Methanosarcinales archaeon]|nr:hypothetical protein [Methanosarcinales archaeon]